MNQRTLLTMSTLIFLAFVLWGHAFNPVIKWVLPGADHLTNYFITKGLFAVALLLVLAKWDGLRNHGFRRGQSWWFLLPAAPFLALGTMLLINPEAAYGLGVGAALGWIMVSIFVAIGEEGVFRGLMWRALEDRGALTTSVVTSLLFGTVHLVGLFTDNPWQIIVSLAVFAAGGGMMFAAVRLVSGSVMAPLVLHAVFDAAALISSGGSKGLLTDTMSVERLVFPGIAFFVWGLICVLVIQRRRRTAMPSATEMS
jgi:membrane protease YdiL (CAAX protease family)